jgi:hypothetical protein
VGARARPRARGAAVWAMSRPSPSLPLPEKLDDPRAELLRRMEERLRDGEARRGRYVDA